MKKESLDKAIRETFENKEFSFDEANWKAFKKEHNTIFAKPKRKHRLIGFIFLGCALFSILFFIGNHFTKELSNATIDNQKTEVVSSKKENTPLTEKSNISNSNELKTNNNSINTNQQESNLPIDNPNTIQPAKTQKFANRPLTITQNAILSNSNNLLKENNVQNEYWTTELIVQPKKEQPVNSTTGHLDIATIAIKSLTLDHVRPAVSLTTQLNTTYKPTKIKKNKRSNQFGLNVLTALGKAKSKHFHFSPEVSFPIAEKWNINTGLGYAYTQASKLPIHRDVETKYNFVRGTFYSNTIEADGFHKIFLPISVSYMTQKHVFDLGVRLEYALLTKGTLRDTKEVIEKARSAWIVEKGMDRVWNSIFLGYSFQLSKSHSIGVSVSKQLRSVLDNKSTKLDHIGVTYKINI